jgi:dTDP-3,4-didehydro-2,6-dideoxy-alpha-D-glucose 3-reductase
VKILIVGYSSIVQRRVVPALSRIAEIDQIDIASLSKALDADLPKAGQHFTDYAEALRQSSAQCVYVSLPNSMHEAWVQACLDAGKHVIVDKPATMTVESANRFADIAAGKGLLFAEATVFDFHPQFQAMQEFVSAAGGLTHIDAQFVIPPLPPTNFRNNAALGGGCLLDMGAYAAGLARRFGGELQRLSAFRAPPYDGFDIDMGFSLAAQFANGVRYTGHFSFESEYQNRLLLVARHGSLLVERLFSPPPDSPPVWQVRRSNAASEEQQPVADVFELFLRAAIHAIYTADLEQFSKPLLADAIFRDTIARKLETEADSTP